MRLLVKDKGVEGALVQLNRQKDMASKILSVKTMA
jgi:hypothetical protein